MRTASCVHTRATWSAAVAAVAAIALFVSASTAQAADRLPDLGMAQLRDLRVANSGGKRLLQYTAIIVNVGAGPFQLDGHNLNTAFPNVQQRVFSDTGGYRLAGTSAQMYFAGDGHNHWHVRDLERGYLVRPSDNAKLRALAKHGFCFFDNVAYRLTLANAPQARVYTSCGTNPSATDQSMGLSVGWGDAYYWNTAGQYIDITGVANGRYRVRSEVNPTLGFVQSNSTNDATWVDIRLKSNSVSIVGYGPSA